ncbi:MAG TPA: hypothetical protein PKD64_00525 [Pirellulaceae bacterium]|nr:hypothetical protein [Pirellulaceae bacterium]HMO90654.1 hypothetical protein [Pirellulaceae bacterium]HMP67767.1 hypothetical protein [Pirellulaceae bacterium]
MRSRSKFYLLVTFVVASIPFLCVASGYVNGQEDGNTKKQIANAANSISRLQKFTFRHSLKKNEELRWDVEHIASVETRANSVENKLSSRTQSTKLWRVIEVDSLGSMTIENSIERLNLWNKNGDEEPMSYDSEKGDKPAPMFETAAENVGVVLSVVTIDSLGNVVGRQGQGAEASFGAGDFTIIFPEEPIAVGHQWSLPIDLIARHKDGQVKQIRARKLFTLDAVDNQVATISLKTEILTPIDDPWVDSQIMQKKNKGKLRFDLAAGRVLSQEIDWNERVQEVEGPDSALIYMARFHEKLRQPRVSSRDEVKNESTELIIKASDSPPILRNR